jgi:hypothetical protein
MTVADDDLWNSLDGALSAKHTRDVTLFQLNRLLRKRFADLPERYLTQQNCHVRREWLTAEQLRTFHPGHSEAAPRRMSGPVVAWEYCDQTYMLDGTNRLNVWLRDGDHSVHETIIVRKMETDDG